MKKLLLSLSVLAMAGMASFAAEPVFPESFDISLSAIGPKVTQGLSYGVYTVSISGVAAEESVTLSMAVPEGWDGFITWSEEDYDPGEINPLKLQTRADDEELWAPMDAMLAIGMKKGDSLTFPVDGEEHIGRFMLYSGDMVYTNQIDVEFNVQEGTPVLEPEFPESFVVTTNPAGLDINQLPAEDWGDGMLWPYSIMVDGKCSEPTATITLEVPEGWTGFIGKANDVSPWNAKRKAKPEFASKDELLEDGYVEGNVIEVPADCTTHTYNYYLLNGDSYDAANAIEITVFLQRTFPGLKFPEEFDMKLSAEGPEVAQEGDPSPWSEHTINVSGKCNTDSITLTLEVPEGWDGFVGATDADFEDSDIQPYATRADEEDEDNQLFFYPLSSLDYNEPPLKKGNEFTFKADGSTHYGMAYLYKENMYCMKMINIEVTVEGDESGISSIEAADKDARYFNLQGVEVTNPENGVFVKIANGKATKVTRK